MLEGIKGQNLGHLQKIVKGIDVGKPPTNLMINMCKQEEINPIKKDLDQIHNLTAHSLHPTLEPPGPGIETIEEVIQTSTIIQTCQIKGHVIQAEDLDNKADAQSPWKQNLP